MKFRNTIQLGAALVLLVLLYFGQQLLTEKSAERVQAAKKVFSFSPEDIQGLTIHRLDEVPTVGVREEGGAWEIIEPSPLIRPYDPLWERVATHVADLKNERSLPEGAMDLETYGLTVPRLTVTTSVAGGDQVLRFGYLEPTQTYRYAQLNDGGVFLVDKDAVFELDRPLNLLRDSFVVDDTAAPILRLEFARFMPMSEAERLEEPSRVGEESPVVIVERADAESPWEQLAPVRVAAKQDVINELVAELQHARGRGHIDAPEAYADYGLEPALARITIVDAAEGYPQTFFFGDTSAEGEKGGIYVRKEGEPSVFLMDAHIRTLFPRGLNSLRERRLFTRAKKITRIEHLSVESNYTLVLGEDGRWRMTDPPLDDTDPFYVSQFISALKMVEANRFYLGEAAEYGLDAPEVTLRLTLADDADTLEIRLLRSADVEGHYYVLTDSGEVASLPEEHIQFLLAGAQAFRDRTLLRFDQLRAVRMDFSFGGTDYTLEKQHDRWLVTVPAGHFMPNQRDAANLLDAVSGLRALGAEDVADSASAEFGFENPRFVFSVTLASLEADGASEVVGPLSVGAVVPGIDQQRFVQSAARTGVFRIGQRFIETVQAAVGGIRVQTGSN